MIILDRLEEEYLVRLCEGAVDIRHLRQLYLWTQGQMQCLLPHHALVCMQFADDDELIQIKCFDRLARGEAFLTMLCDSAHGLAVRLARACASAVMPAVLRPRAGESALLSMCDELRTGGLHHAMVHSTGSAGGARTMFLVLGMASEPGARQQFLFDLILPLLHLAFVRVVAASEPVTTRPRSGDVLSEREVEIVTWVMHGKSNFEIGAILNISTLTVKNHLQKIYRKLNVHSRVQAVSRCWDLQGGAGQPGLLRVPAKARPR